MRELRGDAGNVAIIVALMMTALLGAAALAIDVGATVTTHARLQAGADAAALAIAHDCAIDAIDKTGRVCRDTTKRNKLANDYLQVNGVAPDEMSVALDAAYSGDAGTVTVAGRATDPAWFAPFVGVTEQRAAARAVARWGPLIGIDAAFPLTLCRGVPLDVDTVEPLEIVVDPLSADDPGICVNEPDVRPLGWAQPEIAADCTLAVVLTPPDLIRSDPIESAPTVGGCPTEIDALFDAIASDASADDRTRVLVVTDRQYGGASAGPAHALIAFEFDALRLGSRSSYRAGGTWDGDCVRDDVYCMRGFIREWIPPADGPIADPALIGSTSFDDTTVLDVRLVD